MSCLHISSMEPNDVEEEEFGFSRNYFLAKELGGSAKKSARKVSDIDLVDEQVLLAFLLYFVQSSAKLWKKI